MLLSRLAVFAFCSAVALPAAEPCATCHRQETGVFQRSAMARALEQAAGCEILKEHPSLSARINGYSYTITRDGDRSIYAVRDGVSEIRVPLEWAFGLGDAGQTYAYRHDGQWYESRVSFYAANNGLDLTMGAQNKAPASLEEAAGRQMDAHDQHDCFNCHATHAVDHQSLSLATLVPGVQCARCHENVSQHASAALSGDAARAHIKKLSAISTEELSDFCGQCHRTWAQIEMNGPQSILNVRFQPYRLTKSKCYDAEDRRIRCTACHNPHEPLETSGAAYDAKCAACHGVSAPKCRIASKGCVGCHMQKTDLPGAHHAFTDHWIRIVRAGDAYPG